MRSTKQSQQQMSFKPHCSIKLLCAFSSVLILSACGSGSSSTPANNAASIFGQDLDDCNPVNAGCFFESNIGIKINQFDSRWLSGCELLEDYDGKFSDDAAYRIESLSLAGDNGNRTNNYYTDSSCATPATVSQVASDLALSYVSVFTENTVGVDNIVLANITASNLTFDSAAPTAEQEAEITRSRADRTFYTSMQRIGTALYIAKPDDLYDGSNSGDRVLNPYNAPAADGVIIFTSTTPGIMYTQQ